MKSHIVYTGRWLYTADEEDRILNGFMMESIDGKIKELVSYAIDYPELLRVARNRASELGAKLIDLGNAFVVPGFIDCHVHTLCSRPDSIEMYPGEGREAASIVLLGASHAEELLHAGIVACRDLGSYKGYSLGIRDAIRNGWIKGPLIQTCGKAICACGGHGYKISYEADGSDQIRQAVRRVIKEGADLVKIMVSGGVNSPGPEPGPCELTFSEITTAVETAHALGRKVSVHAHGDTAVRRSIEAGADSVEHGVFMSEDTIELMRERGTWFVPTLSAPYYAVTEGIRREPNNPDHKKSREILQRHREVLKRCLEKDIPIAMGTDAGCPFNPYGKAPYEMVLMSDSGLTPMEALKAATRNGAILMGLSELGSIESGKNSTFICLKGNPLEDIHWVENIESLYVKDERII